MLRPHAPPRRIVVFHPGELGDLVLVETLLAGLRDREPDARIELLCHEPVALIPALYRTPPYAVVAFSFNPYRWDSEPSDRAVSGIRDLAERLGEGIDVFIAAELSPSPLGPCLAAMLGAGELILGSTRGPEASWKTDALLQKLGVAACASIRRLDPIAGEHELDRYARIAGSVRRTPDFRPISADDSDARKLLVFPFGASTFRSWPREQMILAATRIAERYDLAIELVASAEHLEDLTSLGHGFPPDVSVRTASPADSLNIAREVSSASGYVSVDTGLAHLASAYGVPGVTIYGGNNWPAFAPWGPHAAGVVSPLPCFGCRWDCAFDRAFCLEGVTVDSVVAAFADVYERGRPGPLSIAVDSYDAREQAVMGAASAKYREAQADRRARFGVIVQLQAACAERGNVIDHLEEIASARGREIEQLQHACTERLALIESLSEEIDRLVRLPPEAEPERAATERPRSVGNESARRGRRAVTIASASRPRVETEDLSGRLAIAQAAADERVALIDTLDGDLRRAHVANAQLAEQQAALVLESDHLHERIRDLERTAQDRHDEIATLRHACDERMVEIERITAEAERRSALLADMTAAFEAALRRLERQGAGGSPTASRTGGS